MKSDGLKSQNLSSFGKLSILLTIIIVISIAFGVASPVNGFLESIMGKRLQAILGAPLVEEFLKSLPLFTLIIISNRIRNSDFLKFVFFDVNELEFLKSMRWVYLVGIFSGIIVGVYENWFVYGFFSGFRSATPFLHSLGAGVVAIGIYYYFTRKGNWEIKLLSAYVSAVAIHSIWNTLGISGASLALGVMAISVTSILLGTAWYSLYPYLREI